MGNERGRIQKQEPKKQAGIAACLFFVLCFSLLLGCGQTPEEQNSKDTGEKTGTGFVVTGPESFDSADTAILTGKDTEERTVTFYNLSVEKYYTLSYDGTTSYFDKYGSAISLEQLLPGQLVDLTFLKDKKHLTTMSQAKDAWVIEDTTNFVFDFVKNEVTVGADIYKLDKGTHFFTEEGIPLQKEDISASDVLSLYGIDTTVYGVLEKKGHGYLRLANDSYFIDGWIEIGSSLIQKIVPDMRLSLTEGSYQVTVSHNGSSGVKEVVINRGAETILDVGDIEIVLPQEGRVTFLLTPGDAKLYVDGELTDVSYPISLEYGLHQLILKADGYQTQTRYIRVGEESATVEISLETEPETESESETEEQTGYKVYIDAPKEVEVYVDGSFVGLSPCSFDKVAGEHVIILKKTGYTTKSYTITVDEAKKDVSFSFAELEKPSSTTQDTTELIGQIWDNILTE